ncbi:MAG: hypothetical protein IT373_13675 [Polyangiaceae bacterium]|nr:hypothetical protein [Polyangiaceae bacterium]
MTPKPLISRWSRAVERRVLPLGAFAGAAVAGLVALGSRAEADSPYLELADVKPGMKGYGLTVFSGSKPERFGVEVIATLRNFRPNQDLIIIKTDHPRLDVARTVAGMSGSPIFLNDKIIGAYAYGWFFGAEPIAGVTPIRSMLEDLARPLPPVIAPSNGAQPLPGGPTPAPHGSLGLRSGGNLYGGGSPLGYDLRRHAASMAQRTAPTLEAPAGTSLARASTAVMVGGLAPGAMKVLEQVMGPIGFDMVQAGGGATGGVVDPDAPTRYEDGGVINVELVRGDVSVSGLGTVTHVVGDKLVAFGHPMLQGGYENLPTAIGKVHWVLATQNRSFKIGEPVRPLGALVNDRQASIVVDTSRNAPVFPVHVDVTGAIGAPKTSWDMEVSSDPFMAPQFVAVGIGSVLETTAAERLDMTWRARSKLAVKGLGVLDIEDFGAGRESPIGPGDFMRARLARALGVLLNNPWKDLEIERIDTKVDVVMRRDTMDLRGAQVVDPEVEPGEAVRIRLTLTHYYGETETRTIEVPIPRELAGETVEITIGPGYSVDRILPAPESVPELMSYLARQYNDAEAIVCTYRLPEVGAAYRGNVVSRLPPGMADTLRPTTESKSPEMYQAVMQHVIPSRGYLVGQDTVEVKVREVVR